MAETSRGHRAKEKYIGGFWLGVGNIHVELKMSVQEILLQYAHGSTKKQRREKSHAACQRRRAIPGALPLGGRPPTPQPNYID